MHPLTHPRLRLPILLCVAIAARALTFGNPIVHVDEQFYYMVARAMWSGAVPFVDLWDRKPVGLFLLYMPAAAFPGVGGIVAYQTMALVSTVATAWIVARFADAAGWRNGALLAGITYILWLNLLSGAGGQSPVFYNLPMAAAAMLVARQSARGRNRLRGYAAMALVGIALQIKYSVVFEGIFFGIWLLWKDRRHGHDAISTAVYGTALVMLALLPTAAAMLFYAHIDALDAFIFANFVAIFKRGANPPLEMLGNLGTLTLILSPLVCMGLAAWRHRHDGEPPVGTFLLLWLLSSVFGVLIFGTWYDHYGLPVVTPAAASSAWFLGAAKWRGRAVPIILLIVALAGQIKIVMDRKNRGSPAEFARLTETVGHGPGCLYLYSGNSMLYTTTGRCWVTPYTFPSFLTRPREAGAMGVDQLSEIRRILAQRPEVIVMAPRYYSETEQARALVTTAIRRDYRPATYVHLGDQDVAVYRLRK